MVKVILPASGIAIVAAVVGLFAAGCEKDAGRGLPGPPAGRTDKKPQEIKEKRVSESSENPVVVIETSMGAIKAELWADRAPGTVANFLGYVDKEFYDGLIFHRVIAGFMIQGGGFTEEMQQKPAGRQIQNEASAELRNDRGTLAMARTGEVHSATSQFYINLVDNDGLNHKDKTPQGFGYCAFGKVIDGLDVVDGIGKVKTARRNGFDDVPVKAVTIRRIRRVE